MRYASLLRGFDGGTVLRNPFAHPGSTDEQQALDSLEGPNEAGGIIEITGPDDAAHGLELSEFSGRTRYQDEVSGRNALEEPLYGLATELP